MGCDASRLLVDLRSRRGVGLSGSVKRYEDQVKNS